MPEGKSDDRSLIGKSYEENGMRVDNINFKSQTRIKSTSRRIQKKNHTKEVIWVIGILLLFCSPLLFPLFSPIPEIDETIDDDFEEESLDDLKIQTLPDNTLSFRARESITQNRPKTTGTRGFSGTSYPVGDWNIGGVAVVWNETITLDGNLIVNETGNLTLINVTIKMNCSYNGEYRIEVLGGGELYIYDYDQNRFTESDASNITAVNISNKYLFWIQKDSKFQMRNSKMSWCGYEWGINGEMSGLWINTNNSVIDGNIITNFYNGILVIEGNFVRINNNSISDNILDQVKTSGFSVNSMAIYLSYNNDCSVFNNSIYNISGRKWGGSAFGVYMTNTKNTIIKNNIIFNNTGGKGRDNFAHWNNGQNGGSGGGVYIDRSMNSSIIENYITNMTGGNGGGGAKTGGYGGIGVGFNCFESNNISIKCNIILHNIGGNGGSGGSYGGPGGAGISILLRSSTDFDIIDNVLMNNTGGNGFNGGGWGGGQGGSGVSISIVASHQNNIDNNTISNNFMGLRGSGALPGYGCGISVNYYSIDNIVFNSTITNSQSYDLYFNRDSHLSLINSSFDRNKVVFWESKSNLTVGWFLTVEVSVLNIPINNASVRITDNINGTFDNTSYTEKNGYIKWQLLREYVQNSLNKIYYTPYEVEASIDSYRGNETVVLDMTRIISFNFEVTPPPSFIIELHTGWNLVSLPFIQTNTNLTEVLKPIEGKYDAVQYYNVSDTSDLWKHYNITKPDILNDLKSLDHKMGIWIRVNTSESILFNVRGIRPTNQQVINLNRGWNLVGYPSLENLPKDLALGDLNFGSDIDLIQYYNGSSKKWNNLSVNDSFKRGVGYWFHVKSNLTWILNNGPSYIYNLNKDLYYYLIQDAIDGSDPYDTLEISPGIYSENVNINKKLNIFGNGPGSILIDGMGGSCFNISSEYLKLHNIMLKNCSIGISINNSSDVTLKNIIVENAYENAIKIEVSDNITFSNISLNNNKNGISVLNSTNILIKDSTIVDQNSYNFILLNSDTTLLNISLETENIRFLDSNSEVIFQWYLNVQTKDQINNPVKGTKVSITDNENGTYNRSYNTGSDGFIWNIRIIERVRNSSDNVTYTPHNISVSHPGFTFIESLMIVKINASLSLTFISINTVFEGPVHNINKNRYYLTIKEAIEDADPYNTIQITPGTYFENINITKPLTIQGQDMQSTIINGQNNVGINISSDNVIISKINLQNNSYGLYSDSYIGISISNLYVSNNSYGFYINDSSIIFDRCAIENNTFGIVFFNSSNVDVINTTLQNEIYDLSLYNSLITSLNCEYNTSKVAIIDPTSNLTIKWYLHVRVEDIMGGRIEGANVWIRDNENGTYDMNFTTGSDGYVWYIILTERIQHRSGNISFNPYWINVTYFDPGVGWVNFINNPRNITINGSLYNIRKVTFVTPDMIPEFSHVLMPLIAISASFIIFRKKKQNPS